MTQEQTHASEEILSNISHHSRATAEGFRSVCSVCAVLRIDRLTPSKPTHEFSLSPHVFPGHAALEPSDDFANVRSILERHDLPIVGGKIALHDLRIEHKNPDGEMAGVDLELATEHHRSRNLTEKVRVGFSIDVRPQGAGGATTRSRSAGTYRRNSVPMNLPPEHIERIKDLGYTQPEARFLYIVAVFSGYFTLGHFRLFTQSSYGKRSSSFAQKLLKNGHATVRDYMRRGLIFHLFSRTIYGAMEKDNLRNRKPHSFDFIRTRLVLLDFVLANQELAYFETEQDKVDFFCKNLGVSKDFLPAKLYQGASAGPPAVRYFVDKFPLFLSGAPPVVAFSYVDAGLEGPSSFASHLAAYQGLFWQLDSFQFVYIATKNAYFRAAEQRFRSLVQGPQEADPSSEVLRYFEIRRKWENDEYIIPVTRDLEFLKEGRRRFCGERFEILYQRWLSRAIEEGKLRAELSEMKPDRAVSFSTFLVRPHECSLAADPRGADGDVTEVRQVCRQGSRQSDVTRSC